MTKGIILAGGTGSRLYPLTASLNKHQLPVFDKPMIYYPLSLLMLAGIRDLAIVSSESDLIGFKNLFGDGSKFGISINYIKQARPDGISDALLCVEEFVDQEDCMVVLGDNIFYGDQMGTLLSNCHASKYAANIFAIQVDDPQRYGVICFDEDNEIIDIVEKPLNPKSNWAICGLYHLDNSCFKRARGLSKSRRNELEITDLIKSYLDTKDLNVVKLGRGYSWFDVGTIEALFAASQFISIVQGRQNVSIGAIEEIALAKNYISTSECEELIRQMPDSYYSDILKKSSL